ncbi:hypothetical protein NEFER03_1454 [Nematocida sp. LUAm3]|nr:hypothetical protein NEFER03_1454 [Nematocida sp. LUAm3]KAI5174716.1 hypothetical protein NEFER02_0826 [Nematocida sp. LUAm2]KAI5177873.1 hypothetical protein NEFER01_1075 [Nematocida sp. LUAm1]
MRRDKVAETARLIVVVVLAFIPTSSATVEILFPKVLDTTPKHINTKKNTKSAITQPNFLNWEEEYTPTEEKQKEWAVEYYQNIKPFIEFGWDYIYDESQTHIVKWTKMGYKVNISGMASVTINLPQRNKKNKKNKDGDEDKLAKLLLCTYEIVAGVIHFHSKWSPDELKGDINVALMFLVLYRAKEYWSVHIDDISNIVFDDQYIKEIDFNDKPKTHGPIEDIKMSISSNLSIKELEILTYNVVNLIKSRIRILELGHLKKEEKTKQEEFIKFFLDNEWEEKEEKNDTISIYFVPKQDS